MKKIALTEDELRKAMLFAASLREHSPNIEEIMIKINITNYIKSLKFINK